METPQKKLNQILRFTIGFFTPLYIVAREWTIWFMFFGALTAHAIFLDKIKESPEHIVIEWFFKISFSIALFYLLIRLAIKIIEMFSDSR